MVATQWYVSLARDGLKEGFRVIAHHLNQVMREKAPGVRIEAEPIRPNDSLRHAAEDVRRALPGLRTKRPLSPRDSQLAAWTLGRINDIGTPPHWVTVDGILSIGEYDPAPLCEFLRLKNWPPERWSEYIKQPVEELHAANLEMLDDIEANESAGTARLNGKPKRRRGPDTIYDAAADAKLLKDWAAAKRQGTERKDFCKARSKGLKDLIKAQGRQRERALRAAPRRNKKRSISRVNSR